MLAFTRMRSLAEQASPAKGVVSWGRTKKSVVWNITIAAVTLVSASLLFSVTTAKAADLPELVVGSPPPPPPPPPAAAPSFSWSGLYVGGFYRDCPTCVGWFQAGGLIGYNFVAGRFLAGAEGHIWASFAPPGPPAPPVLEARARVGLLVTDRVLVYGLLSAIRSSPIINWWKFGGGLSVGIGERLSIFAEVAKECDFGLGCAHTVPLYAVGVNLHFGR